jgi:valyl-tRNA synthetase
MQHIIKKQQEEASKELYGIETPTPTLDRIITQTVERTVEAVVEKIEKYRESANDHTEPNEVEIVCDDLIEAITSNKE